MRKQTNISVESWQQQKKFILTHWLDNAISELTIGLLALKLYPMHKTPTFGGVWEGELEPQPNTFDGRHLYCTKAQPLKFIYKRAYLHDKLIHAMYFDKQFYLHK